MHGKSAIRSSRLSLLAPLVTALVVTLFVLLAAISARPQNPVPLTAREAAASPQFAGKLHPATRPTMTKPRAMLGGRAGQASLPSGVLYENGPANGTTDAWTINFGYIVSDTFVPNGNSGVSGFDLYVWELPGDSMTSVDWSITSGPNSGTVYGSGTVSGGNLNDQFISTNQFGYDIDKISATSLKVGLNSGQTYWINLQNAAVPSGDPVFWDENSGVGCHSTGCPSQAVESAIGTIASEAFDIGVGGNYPPCFSSEGNMQIIHDFNSKQDGGTPVGGVAADPAGNVYGAMSGGSTGFGMVYEIASKAGSWLFNILYSFTGGSDGAYPGVPMVGPEKVLFGTAGGGNYGEVFSLRPGPIACLTALCSWTETVLYQFADGASAGGLAVFDAAGNIYGLSGSGGAYGKGAVFELTPSPDGWTETILYSFTGGSDGGTPDSLVVGIDGNLYGTAGGGGGAYNAGAVFQLVRPPSEGTWTENVIYSFTGQNPDGGGPYSLVQDGLGNLLGISGYRPEGCERGSYPPADPFWCGINDIVVFMLSPSNGSWAFSVLIDQPVYVLNGQSWWNSDLASDAAGNVYWATGLYNKGCQNCSSPDDWENGGVSMRTPSGNWYTLWSTPNEPPGELFVPGGALAIDAKGDVYGTTGNCGKYGQGTVWKVSQ